MTWVRLDDQFADNPKLERAGPHAAWLQVAGLCYCARHLTDGLIPQGKATRLASIPSPAKHLKALLREGVWHEPGHDCPSDLCGAVPPGHYLIHDYLDYQRSRADVEAERAAEREKKRRQRAKGAESRNPDGTFAGPDSCPPGTTPGTPSVPVPSRPVLPTNLRGDDNSRRPVGWRDDELWITSPEPEHRVARACEALARRDLDARVAAEGHAGRVRSRAGWLDEATQQRWELSSHRLAELAGDHPSATGEELADLLEPPLTPWATVTPLERPA